MQREAKDRGAGVGFARTKPPQVLQARSRRQSEPAPGSVAGGAKFPLPHDDSGARIDAWVDAGASASLSAPRLRIAIYASATSGLGHLRRALRIAAALRTSALEPSILLLAGAREAGAFSMPAGVDCLTLPSLRKEADGHYKPRHIDQTRDYDS